MTLHHIVSPFLSQPKWRTAIQLVVTLLVPILLSSVALGWLARQASAASSSAGRQLVSETSSNAHNPYAHDAAVHQPHDPAVVQAAIHYVTPGGSCGGETPCHATLQDALDAADDGDEIRVAAGAYTGAQTRVAATNGYTYTQIALVDGKSLTLRGGYTPADWTTPDPLANPTILDAAGFGRGLTIVGTGLQSVVVDGFQIVNGDYSDLGNEPGGFILCRRTGSDCGGGLFAYRVQIHLLNLVLRNNVASRTKFISDGGGALLWEVAAGSLISGTRFFSNTTLLGGSGGGLAIIDSNIMTITNSRFEFNRAGFSGGGLNVDSDEALSIENSRFINNRALDQSDARGGAIHILVPGPGTGLTLRNVEVTGNASQDFGALFIRGVGTAPAQVRLVNLLVANNRSQKPGEHRAVLGILNSIQTGFSVDLIQTTWAANQAPAALYADTVFGSNTPIHLALTNTLIASATHAFVGANRNGALTITHDSTLLHNVTNTHTVEEGTPLFVARNLLSGDPLLDAFYRLGLGSAAIDNGVNSGVTTDLDQDVRPSGAGYDVGADEFVPAQPGTLRLSQASYGVDEDAGQLVLVIERVNGQSGVVTVDYGSQDGTATAGQDYQSITGTLVFSDGVTSRAITLTVQPDSAVETDETLQVQLSNPGGGAKLGAPEEALVTLVNDDISPAGQLNFDITQAMVAENSGAVTLTIQRKNGAQGEISVAVSWRTLDATEGEDFTVSPGPITLSDGQTQALYVITLLDNARFEFSEEITFTLLNPTGGATLGSPDTVQLTIVDNDTEFLYAPVILK